MCGGFYRFFNYIFKCFRKSDNKGKETPAQKANKANK